MNPRNEQKKMEIYAFIRDYTEQFGYSPSFAQISHAVGVAKSTVSKFVTRLMQEGCLERLDATHLRAKNSLPPVSHIPIVGSVACGKPTLAQQDIEGYLPMDSARVGDGEYFALIAEGDSMIEAGIESGDTVLVRRQDTAADGEIVVALIDDGTGDGERATLKRFFRDPARKCYILRPQNQAMSDIVTDKVRVIGVARAVIHNL